MLDIKLIREEAEKVKKSLKDRNLKLDVDELLKLDKNRRAMLVEVDELKNKRNLASKEISVLKREKKDAESLMSEMKTVSQKIKEIDTKVGEIDKKISDFTINIPNIPHISVPVGPDAKSNKLVREGGKMPNFSFKTLSHIELGEYCNILNFSAASKLSGAGFSLFIGEGARMVRALMGFMLDLHTKKHGYKEVWPPALVNRASMTATGQLPKLEEDMYKLRDDDLFLIPTAEVPVTNIHRDEILKEEDLPIYYTAYTPCFRREAGSYGKETKGLTRVHQFDKVEMVKFVKPKDSYDELESLLKNAEEVIKLFKIPYRIMALSTGDLSFAASKCYDIEIWAPGIDAWLEVSSCSNFEDFQARRANIKFREKATGKLSFVHTLNGSGVAFARLIAAILENYQKKDGTIEIPKALVPYMGGDKLIKPPKK
ncbi:MAG: serine--tRNA ligase [Candidatus Omnitrophica bacterium]|nr:serine--tRNA ligase [Candidatus Omnitrophota bacterium]